MLPLEFLAGLPGHVGPLPIPGEAFIGERRGNVDHFDLGADAGEASLQRPDACLGGALLFRLVCRRVAFELFPVRPVAEEHAEEHRLATRRHIGIVGVVLEVEPLDRTPADGDGIRKLEGIQLGGRAARKVNVRANGNLGDGTDECPRIQEFLVHGVDPAPIQEVHERVLHVAGRDHVVGFHLRPVFEPHAGGLAIPLQHPGHPCIVSDRSPQTVETRLYGFGESERAADGIAPVFPAHPAERHDDGEEWPGGAVVRVPEAVAEQRILEAGGEGLQREREQFAEDLHERQEANHHPHTVQKPHKLGRLAHGDVEVRKPPDVPAELLRRRGVGRRQLLHVTLQPIEVGIEPEFPSVERGHAREVFVVHDAAPLDRAELPPDLVVRARRPRSHETVTAAVDEVPLPFPRRAQPPGEGVRLDDPGLVAVHGGIAARRKPADSGADDDDGLCHVFISFPQWRMRETASVLPTNIVKRSIFRESEKLPPGACA